ncbi:HAD-IA family hydrolase [Glaciihabitans sp. UYNi722]|uniref:HAD-IA family hydrolase n=1 Tax=Glaciihabitans sp. UYNi722 TaxID=3156344 RepID=UPI003397D53B
MLLFIFDMDEVLYRYDWRMRMAGMTRLTGLSLEQLRERWWHDGGERAAEAGAFAMADDYLEAFNVAIGVRVEENDWVTVRGSAMTPWRDSIAAVERASQLGQVTLLTNNGPLTARHLRTLAPELSPVFGDHLFTSSDYGARKPEPEVFEAVLARYGVEPKDAFFADDMAVNIEGARSIGITAHHFSDSASMLSAIEDFAASR